MSGRFPDRRLGRARWARWLVAVGATATTWFAAAEPAPAAPLQIGTVAWAAYSPLQVADAKGFWSDQSLAVRVTVFPSNQELNAALVAGKIDLALDMIGSWVGLHQSGVPLVILGETDWSDGGDKIIVKPGYDFTKLEGRRVGVYLDQPSVLYFLDRFLTDQRLTLADVEAVELDPQAMTDSFIAGRLSLIVNYDPQALRAERDGRGKVVATSATYPGVIPEGFAALAPKWNKVPEADRARLWRGWVRAVAWAADAANWPEYRRILNERTFPNDDEFSEPELRRMLDAVRIHGAAELAKRNRPGGELASYLASLRAFLRMNHRLARDFDPGELLATDSLVAVCERQ